MQISTATTLFLINWILKFQQGMILLLQCQQSSSLEPALSGRDIKNEKSICFCRGWGSRSAGLATTCSLPPPLATALRCCWHTRVGGVLKPSSQQKGQRKSLILQDCHLLLLFPVCRFLCPCSCLVQAPSPCPRGAGRRARVAV